MIASGGGDILKAYAYEYDRNGNQTLKIEDGRETRYYYDSIGRLETAELPDGTIQHFAYDKILSRAKKKRQPNGCLSFFVNTQAKIATLW